MVRSFSARRAPVAAPCAAMLLWCFASAASGPQPTAPRLIEFAPNVAIFAIGDELHQVAVGDRLPGGEARVVHVGSDAVHVEFPSSAGSEAHLRVLTRGDEILSVEQTASDPGPVPDVTLRQAPVRGAAGALRRAPREGTP